MPSTITNNFVRELIGLGVESSKAAKIGDIVEGLVAFQDLTITDDLVVGDDATVSGDLAVTGNATVTGYVANSVSAAVTAAGTTIADATALTSAINYITSVPASTGVKLPDSPIGSTVVIKNVGGATVNIFPHSAVGKINGGSDGAAVTVTTTNGGTFYRITSANWLGNYEDTF